jgi:hypothetical protein
VGGRPSVRRRAVAAAALLGLGSFTAVAQAAAGSATGHPKHNIAAKPDYRADCANYQSNSTGCVTKALAAINRARSLEHVRPMILPNNFAKLTYAEQTFVISNLERVGRGLAPFKGITAKLNKTAKQAAAAQVDPAPAYTAVGQFLVVDYQSNWASNFGPLAADYGWMYDDGYGSYNVDCTSASAAGCWAHRDIILTKYDKPGLISGVGSEKQNGLVSIAQLFVAGNGQNPTFTYTWRQALRHGADGHR